MSRIGQIMLQAAGSSGAPAGVTDSDFSSVVLLPTASSLDGTITDASSSAHSITANGDVTAVGGYCHFDGSSSGLNIGQVMPDSWQNNDLTIEMWVRSSNWSGASEQTLFSSFGSGVSNPVLVRVNTSGNIAFWDDTKVGGPSVFTGLTANTWQHVCLVNDAGTGFKVFIDGVYKGQSAYTGTVGAGNGGDVWVGLEPWSGGRYPFTGEIACIRVTPSAYYNLSGFTPDSYPLDDAGGTALFYTNFTDPHPRAEGGTDTHPLSMVSGAPMIVPRKQPASYYFNGGGGWLTSTSTATVGTGDFTVEFFYHNNDGTARAPSMRLDTGSNLIAGFGIANYASIFGGGTSVGASGSTTLTSSISVPDDRWAHVAFVRSSGTITVYVDGKSGGSVAEGVGSHALSEIGSMDGGSYRIGASLSQVHLTHTAKYTADFVPPATIEADGSTQFLLDVAQDGTVSDISTNAFTITENGTGYGYGSIDFTQENAIQWVQTYDGSGDNLQMPDSADWTLGTGWTMEAYIFQAGSRAGNSWWGTGDVSPEYFSVRCSSSSNKIVEHRNTSNVYTILRGDAATVSEGRWVHAALVHSGANIEWYFDGQRKIQVAETDGVENFTGNAYVGRRGDGADAHSAWGFQFRLTKGVTRYSGASVEIPSAFAES